MTARSVFAVQRALRFGSRAARQYRGWARRLQREADAEVDPREAAHLRYLAKMAEHSADMERDDPAPRFVP